MQPTRYLIQTSDNSLHGYNREDILRCDLALNKDDPPKQIYRLTQTDLTFQYAPIGPSQIIETSSVSPASPIQSTMSFELYRYDREDILRGQLAPDGCPDRIYRLVETALTVRYDEIDQSELINIPSLALALPTQPRTPLQLRA